MPVNNNTDHSSVSQPDPKPGPFLAKVVSNIDPTYMGILEVEILHPVGGTTSEGQLHQVKYMSPFYGQTSVSYNGETNDYNNTQKSYGFWAVPPDVGTTVVIIFIDGDPKRGYWMGCIPDENMNFMTPGLASTSSVVEGAFTTSTGDSADRIPVAEYNKATPDNDSPANATTLQKPMHPFTQVLDSQGLLLDDIRGITTSSSRRESPSMVFGMSTPGPLDKQSGAQTGNYGKPEHLVTNAPVSRLGGTTFVMDDGDDKFLRKKSPSEGPPEYASLEEGETDGDVTRPANELFRIRTRTGHQILFHNTEDLIYITNSRGTAWIELTSDGKIDIFAQDSISVRTANDMNFYADRDINLEAGRNVNIKAAERFQMESGSDFNVIVGADGKITTTGALDVNTGTTNKFTSGGDTHIMAANTAIDGGNINFNSGVATAASSASALSTFDNPTQDNSTVTSIMLRVPTTEPYPHHENLDPTTFKTDQTDRESGSAIAVPSGWKQYSTAIDTFARNPPPATTTEDQTGV